MPLLKYFDLSLQCFYISLIKIVLASCHLKTYFIITYLLEDEQELSLGTLIRCKRIYNFWCSMLVFYPMPYCLCMLSMHLPSFLGWFHTLTYWQDAPGQLLFFVVFLFQKSSEGNILGMGWKSTEIKFYPQRRSTPKENRRGAWWAHGHPGHSITSHLIGEEADYKSHVHFWVCIDAF